MDDDFFGRHVATCVAGPAAEVDAVTSVEDARPEVDAATGGGGDSLILSGFSFCGGAATGGGGGLGGSA